MGYPGFSHFLLNGFAKRSFTKCFTSGSIGQESGQDSGQKNHQIAPEFATGETSRGDGWKRHKGSE